MRWMWIDQIIELVPEKRLVAIKNVSLAEEYLHDHFRADGDEPALPVLPASLIIEGMAQTAGILVGSVRGFREKVLLAKITSVRLDHEIVPGETVRYEAELQRIDPAGAATNGIVRYRRSAENEWADVGAIDLMFSHAGQSLSASLDLPEHNFVFDRNLSLMLHTPVLDAVTRD
ncbi:MAG: hotdog family protein [Planctomycetota bacterium]|jgi:3-hydroxyacyl-[acyl-carrier-protein] dehydratase